MLRQYQLSCYFGSCWDILGVSESHQHAKLRNIEQMLEIVDNTQDQTQHVSRLTLLHVWTNYNVEANNPRISDNWR